MMRRFREKIVKRIEQIRSHEFGVPALIFAGFTLLVVLPLFFKRGFVFLLDYAPLPRVPFPTELMRNDTIWRLLLWTLDLILPGGAMQKMLLAAILFTAGFGMFVFLRRTVGLTRSIGPYFGGILYMFNPFVYSRLIVGQWIIIAAYALMPFAVASLVRLITRVAASERVWRECAILALFLTAIVIINLHIGIMAILPLFGIGIAGAIFLWQRYGIRRAIILGGATVLAAGLFFLLNSYWIIPTFFGTENIGFFAQHVVSNVDIFSFFTRADANHGVVWNTAGMYGFWADEDSRYVTQKLLVPYWFYLLFLLLGLVAAGAILAMWRPKRLFSSRADKTLWERHYSIGLVASSLVAFFFALGVAYAPIKDVMLWIYDHVPYFRGFREPHKFVALLVFGYAIFGSIAISIVSSAVEESRLRAMKYARLIIPGLLLLIPLSYSPGLLWGLNNQLPIGTYPDSWYKVNEFLAKDRDDFSILVVPWHQYIHLSFANNIVINPADGFFVKRVLAGDNVEFGPIYTQSNRPESRVIEGVLKQGKNMDRMGAILAEIDVKYVIWLLESDFFNYTYLEKQRDLVPVFTELGVKVLQNTAWKTLQKPPLDGVDNMPR